MARSLGWVAFAVMLVALGVAPAAAQQLPPQRTLEELKAEAQARADRNGYPLIGLKPDEVREALGRLKSLDRDEWAASWSEIGERYMQKAESLRASAPAEADKDFIEAWRYFSFARWPVPNSPGKQRAYENALNAFRSHGRLLDPPLEVLRIPFEGKEMVAYRQMPKTAAPAPVVLAICGLDSRKEDMAERFQPMLAHGVGYVAVDMPGTGEAPIKIAPGAERMLSRLLDAVIAMPETDKSRIARLWRQLRRLLVDDPGGNRAPAPQGGGGAIAADRRDFLGGGAGEGDGQPRISLRLHPRLHDGLCRCDDV